MVSFSLSCLFRAQNKIVFYFVFLSFSFSIFMLKCRIHYAVACICICACDCMCKLCVTLTFIAFRNILWGSGAIAFLPKHKHNNNNNNNSSSSSSNNNNIIQRKTKAFVLLNCTSDVIEKRNVRLCYRRYVLVRTTYV